jgi:hypothetical protein
MGHNEVKHMLQMLTLEEWANEKYRSNPPSVSTLRNYAKQNMFSPQPKKKVDSGASGRMLSWSVH